MNYGNSIASGRDRIPEAASSEGWSGGSREMQGSDAGAVSEGGAGEVGEGEIKIEVIHPKRVFKTKPTGRPKGPAWKPTDIKKCTQCMESKPAVEFNWRNRRGRQFPESPCKACAKINWANITQEQKDHLNSTAKIRYRKDPKKFIEKVLVWQRREPEKMQVKALRFMRTPKGKSIKAACARRRRARTLNGIAHDSHLITKEWFDLLCAAQGGLCCYCHNKRVLTMEHIIPLSRGGLHTKENIAGACRKCNSAKNDKLISEWIPKS